MVVIFLSDLIIHLRIIRRLIRHYYCMLLCGNSSQCLKLHNTAWFVPFVALGNCTFGYDLYLLHQFHNNNFSNTLPVIIAIVTMDLLPLPRCLEISPDGDKPSN